MTSPTREFASRIATEVVGPLKGHHHEAYAVRLDPGTPLGARFRWLKLREPRDRVFWYDHRCFASEEQLVLELGGRVPCVPKVVDVSELVDAPAGVTFIEFIEGRTLGDLTFPGKSVPRRYRKKLIQFFGSLVSIDAAGVHADRVCGNGPAEPGHLPFGGDDSTSFLENLIGHTRGVYREKRPVLDPLLDALAIPESLLEALPEELGGLTRRPFALLHGDLHRENLVVDGAGELWTIDWELARIGDPLYDLATHLHLMRYPRRQERQMVRGWRKAVGESSPGASDAVGRDLPRYLAYKRVQSVYTDVMRGAMTVSWAEGGPELREAVTHAVTSIAAALTRARRGEDGTGLRHVGLRTVATPEQIQEELLRWLGEYGDLARKTEDMRTASGAGPDPRPDTISSVDPVLLDAEQNEAIGLRRDATV
ncbi:phosphotransferase [Actinacidiphila glaucinigra]|uniref:Phosphotransferase enzyme family protein n=1 Tax=Actinacidiphila glaucinigra TaxID=235986 RepID=A0A239MGF8_9ACTN|nr:phosphotransferase [Actinacidiphila glaucinigra]SNT42107.1 Phosphotransferase enzyme family protein [Actinacidiphila glaucinigra]